MNMNMTTEEKTIATAQALADMTGVTQYVFRIVCFEEDGYSWPEYDISEDELEHHDTPNSELVTIVLPISKQQTNEEMKE
jgi:hypothetical protein